MKTLYKSFFILAASLVLFQACSKQTIYKPAAPDMAALVHRYKLAVMDAKIAEPWEIDRNLVAIHYYGDSMAGQGNLRWSADSAGRMRLLAVSWMSKGSLQYWPAGKTFKTSSSMAHLAWITTAPEMAVFLQKNGVADSLPLHLRIAQVLGLPPDSPNDYFVEFWVYPENLFRPTPDAEITDHEAGLFFPHGTTPKHKSWFLGQVAIKYDTSTTNAYPWTRLGYTYDWANPDHPFGLSEFVVDTSARVTVKAIYSTREYFKMSQTAN